MVGAAVTSPLRTVHLDTTVFNWGECSDSFPVPRVSEPSPKPRESVERAVRELLVSLSALPQPPSLRVADVEGGVACLVQVWDAREVMPTVGAERRRR